MNIRPANSSDLTAARRLMRPFVARGDLLARTDAELLELLPDAFIIEREGRPLGFVALEVYSPKLSEIQCLSFVAGDQGPAMIKRLVEQCVAKARLHDVLEVMAVVPAALEAVFNSCGFHLALPNQRKAMFVRPRDVPHACPADHLLSERSSEITIRDTEPREWKAIGDFLAPFVARSELLPRSEEQMRQLLQHGFVAQHEGRPVGFVALEIYSPKLAELQCLAVDEAYRGRRIGRRLAARCVGRALLHNVAEVMAITARDEVLRACGFDDCLPGSKTALFLSTRP